MGFKNYDSNNDKVKLYESARKSLAKIYKDEPEASISALVSENPYKDLNDVNYVDLREYQLRVKAEKGKINREYSRVQERAKNLRQKFSEGIRTGRRSGSRQITVD